MTPETWLLISDVHLAPSGPDDRNVGTALPLFLRRVVSAQVGSAEAGAIHLVLLGDSFDLDRPSPTPADRADAAETSLQEVARRFERVFAELRSALDHGVWLHFVCGNHDGDLARPPVRGRLSSLLGWAEGTGSRLQVHPWLLHRPGILYAEHGHQHHALNRSPTLLALEGQADPQPTARAPLAAYVALREEGTRGLSVAGGVVAAMRASWRAERVAGGASYQKLLDEAAAAAGLPGPALKAVHRTSAFSPSGAGIGAATRVIGRRLGRGSPDGYLRGAARRIDHVLAEEGCAPHCYVFGHTHLAALEPIDGTDRFYANTGTWSPQVRGGGTTGFPYVKVTSNAAGKHVELTHWEP